MEHFEGGSREEGLDVETRTKSNPRPTPMLQENAKPLLERGAKKVNWTKTSRPGSEAHRNQESVLSPADEARYSTRGQTTHQELDQGQLLIAK